MLIYSLDTLGRFHRSNTKINMQRCRLRHILCYKQDKQNEKTKIILSYFISMSFHLIQISIALQFNK